MPTAPIELSPDAARRLRLRAQRLVPCAGLPAGTGRAPADVVRGMVALQGQDLPAVLRAIALRSGPGTTVEDVRASFDVGELVRGWTQRGTLFATTPDDLAALVGLTSERVTRQGLRVRETEGLDDAVLAHAEEVAVAALKASDGLTRSAMTDTWREAGVLVDGQRGYHLISSLGARGLVYWGPFAGAQQVLLAARPDPGPPEDPEAALRRIARSYFTSRGPATVDDLAWWLGLPKRPVRAAVAALREQEPETFVDVTVDGQAMLAAAAAVGNGSGQRRANGADGTSPDGGVVLVPGFDEMILGYQDRALVADAEAMRTVVPFTNGTFRPAVLADGRLIGTWRRAPKKDEPPYELVPGISPPTRAAVAAAVAAWHLA